MAMSHERSRTGSWFGGIFLCNFAGFSDCWGCGERVGRLPRQSRDDFVGFVMPDSFGTGVASWGLGFAVCVFRLLPSLCLPPLCIPGIMKLFESETSL